MSLKYNSLVEKQNFNVSKEVKEVNKFMQSNVSFRGRCKCLSIRHVKWSFYFAVFKEVLQQYPRQDMRALQKNDRFWNFTVKYMDSSFLRGCRVAEIPAENIFWADKTRHWKIEKRHKIWLPPRRCHGFHFQALSINLRLSLLMDSSLYAAAHAKSWRVETCVDVQQAHKWSNLMPLHMREDMRRKLRNCSGKGLENWETPQKPIASRSKVQVCPSLSFDEQNRAGVAVAVAGRLFAEFGRHCASIHA